MNKNFTEKDLENVDFPKLTDLNFNVGTDDIVLGFNFAVKDGRIFSCKVDRGSKFNLHSEKYGDFEVDFLQKIAADIINDNDKFFVIIETIKDVTNFIGGYDCDVPDDFDIVMHDECVEILKHHFTYHELIVKYLEMGLDKGNKFVTIEPIMTEENIDFDRTIAEIGDDLDKTCWFNKFSLYFKGKKYRRFFVRVDDSAEYTLHSEKYGDFKANFIEKFTAEVLKDNDKVYDTVQTVKEISDSLIENGIDANVTEEGLIANQLKKLLCGKLTNNEIISKMVEYGLKNDGVTFNVLSR